MGEMNHKKSFDREFVFVASVEASSLDGAFTQSQNDFNASYAEQHIRSTSVGDLIRKADGDTVYMVMGFGFKEMPLALVNISHPDMVK
jgi:hypothetical protein